MVDYPPPIVSFGVALKYHVVQRAMALFRVLWHLSGKF